MTKYAYLHHNQPKSTLEGHIWALINGFISSDLISGFYCISFQCLLECWASALGHWIVRCLRWNPTFELKIMWLAIFFDDNVFVRQPSRFPSIPSGTSPFRDVLENHTYRHMKWFLPAVKPRRYKWCNSSSSTKNQVKKFAPGGLKLHKDNKYDPSKVIRFKLVHHRCLFKATRML